MSADASIKTITGIYEAFGRVALRDGTVAWYRGTEDTAQTDTVWRG